MATAAPPTNASNTELIRWMFERINEHDVEAMRQLWTSDSVERMPDRTVHGADEIAAYFKEAFAAIPDFHMEILAMAEQGDDVFVRWRLTGTHDGPIMGIDPTHKSLAIDGFDHIVLREGKLVSNFVVFDQMQYARQIGMLPPDGSAADKAVKGAFNARTKLVEMIKNR